MHGISLPVLFLFLFTSSVHDLLFLASLFDLKFLCFLHPVVIDFLCAKNRLCTEFGRFSIPSTFLLIPPEFGTFYEYEGRKGN